MLTQDEYNKIVDDLVEVERNRLLESLNALFDAEGHSLNVLIHAVVQAVENQPAMTARMVNEMLGSLGLLPADP